MINYSIIIPHKDIPDLLIRCLNSIPERDDVQIIVVDDNSKDAETYKEKYPELSRPNLDLYLTKEGKGAGYARNVGLDHAKGKWLLFADADDFFSDQVNQIMDEYLGELSDIVYFDIDCVFSEDISKKSGRVDFVKMSSIYSDEDYEKKIRVTHITPWAKFISRIFVKENNIKFQEIKWSNDVFFSTCAGVLAKKIKLSKDLLYIVTERQNSLAVHHKRSREELIVRTRAGLDAYKFASNSGYDGTLSWTVELYRNKYYYIFLCALHELDLRDLKKVYKNAIWGRNKLCERLKIISILFLSRLYPFAKVVFPK